MRRLIVGLAVVLVAAASQVRAEDSPQAPSTEQALAKAQAEVAADSTSAQAQYHLGNAFYDAGKVSDAIKAYMKSVAIDSTYTEALVNLGNAYNEGGQLKQAVDMFEQALRVDPKDDKALSNLGNSYYAMGEYAKGMDAYQRALKANVKCYQAHYNIGVAFADAGIYREAVREWLQVMDLAPGTADAASAEENVKVIEKILGEKYIDDSKTPQGNQQTAPPAGAGAGSSSGAH